MNPSKNRPSLLFWTFVTIGTGFILSALAAQLTGGINTSAGGINFKITRPEKYLWRGFLIFFFILAFFPELEKQFKRLKVSFRDSTFEKILFFLLFLTALSWGLILKQPLGPDQSAFQIVGQKIIQGDALYLDIFDLKPPFIYYSYAIWGKLFAWTAKSINFLELLLTAGTAVLIFLFIRILSNRVTGLLGVCFYLLYCHPLLLNDNSRYLVGQTESFLQLIITASYLLTLIALRGSGKKSILIAGILISIAFFYKYTAAVYVFPVIFVLALKNRLEMNRRPNLSWKMLHSWAIAGAGTFLILIFFFWQAGFLKSLWDSTWGFNFKYYLPASPLSGFQLISKLISEIIDRTFDIYQGMLWIPAFVFIFKCNKKKPESVLIASWLVFGILAVLAGRMMYLNHFTLLYPALSIAAAYGIYCFFEQPRFQSNRKLTNLCFLIASYMFLFEILINSTHFKYLTGSTKQEQYITQLDHGANGTIKGYIELSDYLQKNSEPKDSIYLWGWVPEVYVQSQRDCAGRFINTSHLILLHEGGQPNIYDQEIKNWEQNSVKYIILAENDRTGSLKKSYKEYFEDSIILSSYLNEFFALERVIGEYQIYSRKLL